MRACVLVIYGLFFVGVERVFPLSYIGFVTFGPEMDFFSPFFVVFCFSWRV
jgi:hypothetical protein